MVLATTGPTRVRHATTVLRNVGEIERILSVLGGSALAAAALRRRGAAGVALALVGAELVRRGVTGRSILYETLGVSTARDGRPLSTRRTPHDLAGRAATVDAREAIKVEQSITVSAPAEKLYAFWRDFRNHPRFMKHLEHVELVDDKRSRWTMRLPMGRAIRWDSEVINDIPNQLIAWKAVGESDLAHAGSVHFRPAAAHRGTEVRMVMDYEPILGRPGHLVAKLLRVSPEQLIREDLQRFKQLMETGEIVTTEGQPTA